MHSVIKIGWSTYSSHTITLGDRANLKKDINTPTKLSFKIFWNTIYMKHGTSVTNKEWFALCAQGIIERQQSSFLSMTSN